MKIKNNRIIPIDFSAPWWHVLLKNSFKSIFIYSGEIFCNIFFTLIPMMFGIIFASKRLDLLCYLFGSWILVYFLQYATRTSYARMQSQIIHSLHASAHIWFLQADPIYHTRKSSGIVLGKIDRAARSYESLLDSCMYELLSIGVGVITVIVTLFMHNKAIGLAVSVVLLLLASLIIFIAQKIIQPLEQEWTKADDKVRSISVENLNQINLIRSSFASNETCTQLKRADINMIEKESYLWIVLIRSYLLVRILYALTIFFIALYILLEIIQGSLTEAVGIGFIGMYISGTKEILRLDRPVREITKSITRMNDLRTYIEGFGKQTYPVLKEDSCEIEIPKRTDVDPIKIEATNLFFDYHARAKIFDNHTLIFTVDQKEPIKLYGIIGPSGIGKSTLLSILGGQLNPTGGMVLVAGINIYKVDDNIRRKIIALQGQVATNIRGTLKYNLLFGIPEKVEAYSDDHLVTILKKVGIWSFFEAKEGLFTFIGEGGLNLSGGQRQRLNFANLYLRAHYFKPALVLIDEPTSSLDEVSEQTITDMIIELSEQAVTIVIAHRLKTVSKAAGILDCSLLSQSKTMRFYTHEQLLTHSDYYKKLMYGKVAIED